jgi:hypothetical protein
VQGDIIITKVAVYEGRPKVLIGCQHRMHAYGGSQLRVSLQVLLAPPKRAPAVPEAAAAHQTDAAQPLAPLARLAAQPTAQHATLQSTAAVNSGQHDQHCMYRGEQCLQMHACPSMGSSS